MPTVEKTAGSRVYVRLVGRQFDIGDRADVSADEAEYLCDDRGDFERVTEAADGEEDEIGPDVTDEELDEAREEVEDAVDAEVVETCQEVKSDGEVCGRELPCQYHSEG